MSHVVQAIQAAQRQRDDKVLEVLCRVLGVEPSLYVLQQHKHRLRVDTTSNDGLSTYSVDGVPVCTAGPVESGPYKAGYANFQFRFAELSHGK